MHVGGLKRRMDLLPQSGFIPSVDEGRRDRLERVVVRG
jgi:hypothetical protein